MSDNEKEEAANLVGSLDNGATENFEIDTSSFFIMRPFMAYYS